MSDVIDNIGRRHRDEHPVFKQRPLP
jgi:hypothetical protein